MLRKALFIGITLLCASCASVQTDDQVTSRFDPDRIEVDMDRDTLAKSIQSPLYMLNIKKEDIPHHLPDPAETYAEPTSCLVAKVEYDTLNTLLGTDEASAEAAEFSSISLDAGDAIESTISDFIPFESVIKYVSGATKHEKKVASAYFRGQIRRAYLRGYINRNMCKTPVPVAKPDGPILTAQIVSEAASTDEISLYDSHYDIYVSPEPRQDDEPIYRDPQSIGLDSARVTALDEGPAGDISSTTKPVQSAIPVRARKSRLSVSD